MLYPLSYEGALDAKLLGTFTSAYQLISLYCSRFQSRQRIHRARSFPWDVLEGR